MFEAFVQLSCGRDASLGVPRARKAREKRELAQQPQMRRKVENIILSHDSMVGKFNFLGFIFVLLLNCSHPSGI